MEWILFWEDWNSYYGFIHTKAWVNTRCRDVLSLLFFLGKHPPNEYERYTSILGIELPVWQGCPGDAFLRPLERRYAYISGSAFNGFIRKTLLPNFHNECGHPSDKTEEKSKPPRLLVVRLKLLRQGQEQRSVSKSVTRPVWLTSARSGFFLEYKWCVTTEKFN